MHASTSSRSRTSFVPWCAALIISASAQLGGLARGHRTDFAHTHVLVSEAPPADRAAPRHQVGCRGALRVGPAGSPEPALTGITRSAVGEFVIEREHLGRLTLTPGLASIALGLEVRRVARRSLFYQLGLRSGDRIVAISSPGAEQFEVTVMRRGRPLALRYRLS